MAHNIDIPQGLSLVSNTAEVARWKTGLADKLQAETHLRNKPTVAIVGEEIVKHLTLNDEGALQIEITARELSELTGLPRQTAWRTMHFLVEENFLHRKHSACMFRRSERSVFCLLIPSRDKSAVTSSTSTSMGGSSVLPSIPPFSSYLKTSVPSCPSKEITQVTELQDPRHNVWHGRRSAWLIYTRLLELTFGKAATLDDIRKETGLSRHVIDLNVAWMVHEGILNWVDTDCAWGNRMVEASGLSPMQEAAMHHEGIDHYGILRNTVAKERMIHRRWIQAGCLTKMRLSAQWQQCAQAFRAMLNRNQAQQASIATVCP